MWLNERLIRRPELSLRKSKDWNWGMLWQLTLKDPNTILFIKASSKTTLWKTIIGLNFISFFDLDLKFNNPPIFTSLRFKYNNIYIWFTYSSFWVSFLFFLPSLFLTPWHSKKTLIYLTNAETSKLSCILTSYILHAKKDKVSSSKKLTSSRIVPLGKWATYLMLWRWLQKLKKKKQFKLLFFQKHTSPSLTLLSFQKIRW